jgi:hypothetical protein
MVWWLLQEWDTPMARFAPFLPGRHGLTDMRASFKLIVLWCALAVQSVWAGEVRTSLQVSATVVAHARIDSVDSAQPVTVAAVDVVRGYVDVSRRYRLRTNAPHQALIQLQPKAGLTHAIDVAGLGAPVRLVDRAVSVGQSVPREFALSFRLWLEPAVVPGQYAMPVQVSAAIL